MNFVSTATESPLELARVYRGCWILATQKFPQIVAMPKSRISNRKILKEIGLT